MLELRGKEETERKADGNSGNDKLFTVSAGSYLLELANNGGRMEQSRLRAASGKDRQIARRMNYGPIADYLNTNLKTEFINPPSLFSLSNDLGKMIEVLTKAGYMIERMNQEEANLICTVEFEFSWQFLETYIYISVFVKRDELS